MTTTMPANMTKSQRSMYSQWTKMGVDHETALVRVMPKGWKPEVAAAPVAARSAPARRAPSRQRNDCVRGWEHDVE